MAKWENPQRQPVLAKAVTELSKVLTSVEEAGKGYSLFSLEIKESPKP
jgi:hypothetical protein